MRTLAPITCVCGASPLVSSYATLSVFRFDDQRFTSMHSADADVDQGAHSSIQSSLYSHFTTTFFTALHIVSFITAFSTALLEP
jgi:hypothetical protein